MSGAYNNQKWIDNGAIFLAESVVTAFTGLAGFLKLGFERCLISTSGNSNPFFRVLLSRSSQLSSRGVLGNRTAQSVVLRGSSEKT